MGRFSLPFGDPIFCYPNPVKNDYISFAYMPPEAEISIFNIYGDLVKEEKPWAFQPEYQMGLTNNKGESLANGTYIYIIKTEYGLSKGKFAILR